MSLVKASPDVIYIRANGAIDPPTPNITSSDNVTYTFTDNIFNCSIVVERNNIVIDGANKTLQGTGTGRGIDLTGRSNVTVKNLEIKEFDFGIYLWSSSNITITQNKILNNTGVGIYLRYTLNSNLTENIIMENNEGGMLLFQLNNNTRIIRNNMTNNGEYGIQLMYGSNYSLISENYIRGDMWDGISLHWSSNYNTIVGNNITENNLGTGISIWDSSNNNVSGNLVTNTYNGISLFTSSDNIIYANTMTNSSYIGFTLYHSYNNSLSENSIRNSTYNFDVSGDEFNHFMNSIDTSNLVNDKPIYYYVNETDLMINPVTHPQIGYLAIINSVNVTVEHQTLTDNAQGILLAYSNDSKIKNNNIIANEYGVVFVSSSNNTLFGNNITANDDHGIHLMLESSYNVIFGNILENPYYGIEIDDSFNNTIFENKITDSEYGIYLYDSFNNTLYGNWIADNQYGVYLDYSDYPNSFYHNNFLNNIQHVYLVYSDYVNFWDNGFEGNYWSNYTGVDLDHDGIGDTPHTLDEDGYNQDNYPLLGLFNSFNTFLGYKVNVISNSTIDSFEYFDSNNTIKMYVSNMTTNQAFGFCRISIHHTLMNVSAISVIIDNGLTPVLYNNYTLYDNGTHRWIYFAYEHSTHEINIIPEFPSIIIPLSLTVTTLLVIACKRKGLIYHFSTFKEQLITSEMNLDSAVFTVFKV
jgi:parallel beta-helix repeat protein